MLAGNQCPFLLFSGPSALGTIKIVSQSIFFVEKRRKTYFLYYTNIDFDVKKEKENVEKKAIWGAFRRYTKTKYS